MIIKYGNTVPHDWDKITYFSGLNMPCRMPHQQPHDRLIKETLSFLPEAVRFFRKFLPAQLSEKLDFRTLKPEDITYLDEKGKETYSDLVFSCAQKNGERVYLQFLVEHKSKPEKRPHLQIGAYLSEGYIGQAKLQTEQKEPFRLIPIVPIILYHGLEPLNLPQYLDYFPPENEVFAEYLPAFQLIAIDLSEYSDEAILELGMTFLTATLLLFKHKEDKSYVLNNTSKIFIFVKAKGNPEDISRFFRVIILYLFRAFRFQQPEIEKLVNDLPKNTIPMFESTYDVLIQEGMIKGEAIGIQKGEAIGIQKGEAIGIQKGEAIGIQKGETLRSLEMVLDAIFLMPTLGAMEISRLSKLPEAFVRELVVALGQKDLRKAQEVAAELFSRIPNFSEADIRKVQQLVRKSWEKTSK
jgi:predicted transposase YdaD